MSVHPLLCIVCLSLLTSISWIYLCVFKPLSKHCAHFGFWIVQKQELGSWEMVLRKLFSPVFDVQISTRMQPICSPLYWTLHTAALNSEMPSHLGRLSCYWKARWLDWDWLPMLHLVKTRRCRLWKWCDGCDGYSRSFWDKQTTSSAATTTPATPQLQEPSKRENKPEILQCLISFLWFRAWDPVTLNFQLCVGFCSLFMCLFSFYASNNGHSFIVLTLENSITTLLVFHILAYLWPFIGTHSQLVTVKKLKVPK